MNYFIIGMNKTGTSCIRYAIASALNKPFKRIDNDLYLGKYNNLNEILLKDKNNSSIIDDLCSTIDASDSPVFKDRPWNCNFHKELHQKYPNSKFILTIRDPEQWWESVKGWIDSKHADKINKQKLIEIYEIHLGTNFNKEDFIGAYIRYNNNIIDYFKDNINFYIMNMPVDFNWQKIKDIVDLDTNTIRENIKLFLENKKSRPLNKIARSEEFNENLDRWNFPIINARKQLTDTK
jgi:hypothetical protein